MVWQQRHQRRHGGVLDPGGRPAARGGPLQLQGPQLLGQDSGNQGNEAVGVWSLGGSGDGTNYLAGGFGATRGADLPDIRPEPDAGEGSQTKILPNGDIMRDINEIRASRD